MPVPEASQGKLRQGLEERKGWAWLCNGRGGSRGWPLTAAVGLFQNTYDHCPMELVRCIRHILYTPSLGTTLSSGTGMGGTSIGRYTRVRRFRERQGHWSRR